VRLLVKINFFVEEVMLFKEQQQIKVPTTNKSANKSTNNKTLLCLDKDVVSCVIVEYFSACHKL
jgi:hypothetical protein